MGNFLIITFFVALYFVWIRLCALLTDRWKKSQLASPESRPSLKRSWYWGVAWVTIGLLLIFSFVAMLLPWAMTVLYSNPDDVSMSWIAISLLAFLMLGWVVALSNFRVALSEIYDEDFVQL